MRVAEIPCQGVRRQSCGLHFAPYRFSEKAFEGPLFLDPLPLFSSIRLRAGPVSKGCSFGAILAVPMLAILKRCSFLIENYFLTRFRPWPTRFPTSFGSLR